MSEFLKVLGLFLLFFVIFLTGCIKTLPTKIPLQRAYCVNSFSTYVRFCDVRRPLSNHVQDGSLIAIRIPEGKVLKVAAYYDSRWELCLPKTYKSFFKKGNYATVEVLRCGYSKNKPYCPYTVKEGYASWYGYGDGSGKWTASGRPFVPESYGLANKELPFGTLVKITNLLNGKSVYAVVLDRGPYVKGRDFDLYPKTMRVLGGIERGVIPVRVEVIRCGWDVKY
jgi:rare lipoprotein A